MFLPHSTVKLQFYLHTSRNYTTILVSCVINLVVVQHIKKNKSIPSTTTRFSVVHTNYIYLSSSSFVFSPKAGFWQEPEPSQATGMALAHCILGSFLGVGCHCFPPPLDVPACCGFFRPKNPTGRDRTRDLGYQRPAC